MINDLGYDVESYERMKAFYEKLYKKRYRENLIYSLVCQPTFKSIWGGWRKASQPFMDNAFEYRIDKKEAKNFTKETYNRAVSELLKIVKQQMIVEKLEELEQDFKR